LFSEKGRHRATQATWYTVAITIAIQIVCIVFLSIEIHSLRVWPEVAREYHAAALAYAATVDGSGDERRAAANKMFEARQAMYDPNSSNMTGLYNFVCRFTEDAILSAEEEIGQSSGHNHIETCCV
jgi:hypothetical protein